MEPERVVQNGKKIDDSGARLKFLPRKCERYLVITSTHFMGIGDASVETEAFAKKCC